MKSSTGKALAAALALMVAIGLFVVLRDDDGESNPPPTTTQSTGEVEAGGDEAREGEPREAREETAQADVPTIVIEGGQPVGGVEELEVAKGDELRFTVKSDVAEEVHLHGYDVSQDVSAGGEVEFKLSATIEGVFEVELEHSAVPIAEISVVPS